MFKKKKKSSWASWQGHRAAKSITRSPKRSLCSVLVMKRATVHVFVVLPKTLATSSAFPSISTIKACEGAYLTKSVLWTLRSVCSFLGRAIYLCPTDDLTSKVFPVNTGHKKTIERRQTGRRVDLILEACRRQRTCGRCLIADPCSCRCDCTFVWDSCLCRVCVCLVDLFKPACPSARCCAQTKTHLGSWVGNPWSGLVYLSAGEISSASHSAWLWLLKHHHHQVQGLTSA